MTETVIRLSRLSNDGAYYLLTLSSNKELLLEGVDDAYALAVKNKDKNKQEVAMVVHKDGAWHIINGEGGSHNNP